MPLKSPEISTILTPTVLIKCVFLSIGPNVSMQTGIKIFVSFFNSLYLLFLKSAAFMAADPDSIDQYDEPACLSRAYMKVRFNPADKHLSHTGMYIWKAIGKPCLNPKLNLIDAASSFIPQAVIGIALSHAKFISLFTAINLALFCGELLEFSNEETISTRCGPFHFFWEHTSMLTVSPYMECQFAYVSSLN
ncbi:hypothetical protein HELRODRAFT_178068 [Helobdella robusta]|uniref:Uncharacterized protein n=1 Tax=Helobdella robusta TaxID=6412 RepID=T1FCP2_HELRO|nr:hypothetical protein HELRODRAFT_178068 [Helobdella robusta]ESN97624.1 hypothetical protein HELRODRAFT_178068 [Helobdella robusta]